MKGIAALRGRVTVLDDGASREAAGRDFGGVVHRRPAAVVVPRSPEDVRRTLEFAGLHRRPVAVRGAGHSQAGQSLTDAGLVLDMTGLDGIGELRDGAIRVQAGATWHKLVRHVHPRGFLPHVLTTNLDVTVGGTLSMGGFGTSSHRYGSQADNVDELVVVTGDARILRCSRARNSELFDCVRCGLGQFGVIVEARVRLRGTRPRARSFHLAYDGLEELLRDQRQAMLDGRFEFISSTAVPRGAGLRNLLAGRSIFRDRSYLLTLTLESDRDSGTDAALAGFDGGRLIGTRDVSLRDVVSGPERAAHSGPGDGDLAHPWIEAILPWRGAERCVEEILDELPASLPLRTSVILWAAPRDRFDAPMLALPDAEFLLGFGLQPATAPAALPRLLPALEAAGRRLEASGGKRYLSGWTSYDHDEWRTHFGDLWPRLLEWKAAFDPHRILSPGAIRYEPARRTASNRVGSGIPGADSRPVRGRDRQEARRASTTP